ncbi:MAG TPA: 3'(2'),5'-bisphosphate nucleotidase CysQ [Candidatus Alistipes intestinigallinarum]|uniref:3'(2'),5'-bisphosphate nucleotidase CysQ n=1 Tax=Candidatus Alistipes intestinigallinarum TaxID=2838440 RepID=A0A9D1Z0S7_9BACT|nr:3'(2'),5'-bisphosphate nucleotidase CysQ [Candidatus Alistipes intestinigallinarum]
MINDKVRMYLLPPLFNAAVRAGASIMQVYKSKNLDDYDISLKNDHTPITLADRVAHRTIREYLGPTRIPILSEEGREMRYEERCNWELYWLVDPLDGTVEFIKGNNEFTVNIALMENNVCIGAVIYVPYYEKMYVAGRGSGSYVKERIAPDPAADYTYEEIVRDWTRLPLAGEAHHDHLRVALSRSHQTPETHAYVARLRERYPDLEVVEQGSSYKFCLLAEGRVDYYVRTTHTYEWDTAAGELILSEAGGTTRALPEDRELRYNEEDLHNPWFHCRSKFCPF